MQRMMTPLPALTVALILLAGFLPLAHIRAAMSAPGSSSRLPLIPRQRFTKTNYTFTEGSLSVALHDTTDPAVQAQRICDDAILSHGETSRAAFDLKCQAFMVSWVHAVRRYLIVKVFESEISAGLESKGYTLGVDVWEGHIGTYDEKIRVLYNLATDPRVETVCEIGFNAGHSAATVMLANLRVDVISFDIGRFAYTADAASINHDLFPGRQILVTGKSQQTVPAFLGQFPGKRCNVLFVDGSHGYEDTVADLRNFGALANESFHVVVIDDVEDMTAAHQPAWKHHTGNGPADAWDRLRDTGEIVEIDRVSGCGYDCFDFDPRLTHAKNQSRLGGGDFFEPITTMMFPCAEAIAHGKALGSSELAWGRYTRPGGAGNGHV